jgi:Flp pilus assembly protein TadB
MTTVNFGRTGSPLMPAGLADVPGSPEGKMEEKISMSTCPMAKACRGMTEKPRASLWMIVPGLIFLALGIAIILYPQILVWLVAIVLIAMGLAMLMMVNFMRGFGKRIHNKPT